LASTTPPKEHRIALPNPDLNILTVADAAELLRVFSNAVAHFSDRGVIPTPRGGPEPVPVRHADLVVLFDPTVADPLDPEDIPQPGPPSLPPPSSTPRS